MFRKLILWIILGCFPTLLWATTTIHYEINGISGEPLKNVMTNLTSTEKNLPKTDNLISEETVKDFFGKGDTLIRNALQPYGYFYPTIHSRIEQNESKWIFYYQINPGRSVQISNLEVQVIGAGENTAPFKALLADFPLKIGQRFTVANYNTAKQKLFFVADNNGYINAQLQIHKVIINPEKNTAKIRLIFNTGERYYYGLVEFSPTPLSDSFLRRYIPFRPGEPMSSAKTLQLQQNLAASGFFQEAMVQPKMSQAKNHVVPIYVSLKPVKKMRHIFGLGWGTDTGFRAQIGWQWRLINKYGNSLEADYSLSQIGNAVGLTYYIPGGDPVHEQYTLNANSVYYKTAAGSSRFQNYGSSFISTYTEWQTTINLSYQAEINVIPDQGTLNANLIIPSITWSRLITDNMLQPTYGSHLTLNIRGADEKVLSTTSFAQTHLAMRFINSLSYRNRLFSRMDLGATSISNFSTLPLSLTFTTGGAQSVRAYGYQSLGPGPYLFDATIEYQFRVYDEWFATAFHDAGNAFNQLNAPQLKQSVGLGVLWQSPIGSMELSVSNPMNDPSRTRFWSGVSVDFAMGSLL
jgi:translocation and assembly module TamA